MQQSISSDMSTWLQFFKDASIPAQYATIYANKFTENRIRFDMLSDLDKPLLNEMGINAIGDVLSIIKYAKLINTRLEERKKEFTITTTTPLASSSSGGQSSLTSVNLKSRCEVAKRIIETYLCDPDAKPLNDNNNIIKLNNNPTNSASTSLSADLISRLNFNPLNQQQHPMKITFNNDESVVSSKLATSQQVSSTTRTEDEEDDEIDNVVLTNTKKNLKRKYQNDDEKQDEDDNVNSNLNDINIVVTANGKKRINSLNESKPLEYRGLLKQPQTAISIKSPSSNLISLKKPTRNLSLNEAIKLNKNPVSTNPASSIQGRLSIGGSLASKNNTNNSKVIKLNKDKQDESNKISNDKLKANLESIRSQIINEAARPLFQRITQPESTQSPSQASRLYGRLGLTSNNVTEKATKIIPITFDSNNKVTQDANKIIKTNNNINRDTSSPNIISLNKTNNMTKLNSNKLNEGISIHSTNNKKSIHERIKFL